MKTKPIDQMYRSPLAMFAFFLGRAEVYRLSAKHAHEISRLKANRHMMRQAALAAVRCLKMAKIGGGA